MHIPTKKHTHTQMVPATDAMPMKEAIIQSSPLYVRAVCFWEERLTADWDLFCLISLNYIPGVILTDKVLAEAGFHGRTTHLSVHVGFVYSELPK